MLNPIHLEADKSGRVNGQELRQKQALALIHKGLLAINSILPLLDRG